MGICYYPHSVQEEGEPLSKDGEPSPQGDKKGAMTWCDNP